MDSENLEANLWVVPNDTTAMVVEVLDVGDVKEKSKEKEKSPTSRSQLISGFY